MKGELLDLKYEITDVVEILAELKRRLELFLPRNEVAQLLDLVQKAVRRAYTVGTRDILAESLVEKRGKYFDGL